MSEPHAHARVFRLFLLFSRFPADRRRNCRCSTSRPGQSLSLVSEARPAWSRIRGRVGGPSPTARWGELIAGPFRLWPTPPPLCTSRWGGHRPSSVSGRFLILGPLEPRWPALSLALCSNGADFHFREQPEMFRRSTTCAVRAGLAYPSHHPVRSFFVRAGETAPRRPTGPESPASEKKKKKKKSTSAGPAPSA